MTDSHHSTASDAVTDGHRHSGINRASHQDARFCLDLPRLPKGDPKPCARFCLFLSSSPSPAVPLPLGGEAALCALFLHTHTPLGSPPPPVASGSLVPSDWSSNGLGTYPGLGCGETVEERESVPMPSPSEGHRPGLGVTGHHLVPRRHHGRASREVVRDPVPGTALNPSIPASRADQVNMGMAVREGRLG